MMMVGRDSHIIRVYDLYSVSTENVSRKSIMRDKRPLDASKLPTCCLGIYSPSQNRVFLTLKPALSVPSPVPVTRTS